MGSRRAPAENGFDEQVQIMSKFKYIPVMLPWIPFTGIPRLLTQPASRPAMDTPVAMDGMIYIFVAILVLIFVIVPLMLIRMEKRLGKLERQELQNNFTYTPKPSSSFKLYQE